MIRHENNMETCFFKLNYRVTELKVHLFVFIIQFCRDDKKKNADVSR